MNANEQELPPAGAPESDAEPTPQPAGAKPKRRRAPRPRDAAPGVEPIPAAAPADDASRATDDAAAASDDAAAAPASVHAEPMAAEAPAAAAVGDGVVRPEGERGSRRGRNRRRGRRGDRRPEGGEGGAASQGSGAETAAPRAEAPDAHEQFAEVLSGAYDVEPPVDAAAGAADAVAAPARRVLAPEPDAPKLHKVLAQAGLGSRRDLEQMIVEGRLTVNGQPAHTGQRVSFGDRIQLDGKPVRYRIAPPPPRVLAYHKPAGEVVTHDDPQQRPTVFRRLPRLLQGKWQSVGRLDINTEGLLLFTSSGELANQLMHPRFGVEREYAVRSLGVLSEEAQARLQEGVEIDGQRAALRSIDDGGGGEGANHWYRVVITEGRNREVRKLFEAVGHAVSRLIRIRYGSVVMPRGLERGAWVELDAVDVRALRRAAGVPQRAQGAQGAAAPGEAGEGGGRRGRKRRPADRVRGPRPDMGRGAAAHDAAGEYDDEAHEPIDGASIPNPLQQTYDKRAIQQARSARREIPEDGPIPNPLQQTYDKRALQRERQPRREYGEDGPIPNPLQQTYDKRFTQGAGAGPRPKSGRGGKQGKPGKPGKGRPGARGSAAGGAAGQPDPMRTSVGYIGADAFLRRSGRGGRGPGGSRGPGGGRAR
ncbi:MAG: rRNA pseudouridine synthase [Comamonadaceae bacterium]|nr:rRNA pseudouridine synthase [Comamonadaceae bacterium]